MQPPSDNPNSPKNSAPGRQSAQAATDRVGFIGGGQMATALASGAIRGGLFATDQLHFAEPLAEQRELLRTRFPEAEICEQGGAVLSSCDRVILAVKPHILSAIAPQLVACVESRHLLVSIAAGVNLTQLQTWFGTQRIVRVMPNTPSQVGCGAAAIAADESALETDVAWVERLMQSVGLAVRVPDRLLHAVTGVSGSGPAYVYMLIEALSDGGVHCGLPRETATRLAAQTVLGAAQMVLQSGQHPGQLKDQVTSPGGTTIAAVRQLEKLGLRSATLEAVIASASRSEELGQ